VGVGVVSPRMPFYVSRSHLPISLAGATSGQAVFGSSSGANIALGSVTGSVATGDVDTIQARVGTGLGALKVNPLGGITGFGGPVLAPSFSGNLNASQLTSGTVPMGRLAGAYPGITQLGSTLNAGAGLTITGNLTVNGALSATDLSASQLTIGLLPAARLAGGSYSVASFTATTSLYSPKLENFGGPVEIRPNHNGDRNFVVSNGIPGSASQGGQGHYLRGRLSLASSYGEKSGLWFANIDNSSYPHFLGRSDDNLGIRIYSGGLGANSLTISDGGLLFPYAPGGSGTQLSYTFVGSICAETSLRSLKDNITDIENPWEIINSIRPRSFTWKPPAGSSELVSDLHNLGVQYGFIVEELIEDAPRLVQYAMNEETPEDIATANPKSYDNRHLISLTVAAVQDLKAQITALETRIESLEA